MPFDQALCDAFHRMGGASQESLDRSWKIADELRAIYAARDAQPVPIIDWTDSELEVDNEPLTPPESPRDPNGPDLSRKAWHNRTWADMGRGTRPEDSGFHTYEGWRSYAIAEHAKKHAAANVPTPHPSTHSKPTPPKKRSLRAVEFTER